MTKDALTMIENAMDELSLEYAFIEYSGNSDGEIVYPYFVGEYTETEPLYESGYCETSFIITGFTRGSWDDLETAKDRLRRYFNPITGCGAMAEDGTAIAIFYASAFPVRTGDYGLKKIQINLNIKEWMVI